jgi:histidinol-phosphate aminotransferase
MTPSDGTRPAAALWLKSAARALPPTRDAETAGDLAARGLSGLRLLHLNESPYPPSPRALAAMARAGTALHRYPAVRGQPLAAALATRTGIPASRIVIGSGSGELILFACILTLLPGDHVVGPAPSFPAYAHAARLFGAATLRAKLDAAGAPDAQTLVAAITNRTRLVFTCTPNPPSGGMMDEAALAALAAGVPETVLLVVDEAYHEFARRENGPDVLAVLAQRRGPWIVLRTFSKAYGLAGLRIGYALCGSDDVADAFRRAMVPYNVTNVGLDAAVAALEDEAHLDLTVELVARERRRLGDGLTRLGLAPLPSVANFLSVRLPGPAADMVAALRQRGILVRDWRDPDHLNEIRITIGTPDDTNAVVQAMAEIVASADLPVGA